MTDFATLTVKERDQYQNIWRSYRKRLEFKSPTQFDKVLEGLLISFQIGCKAQGQEYNSKKFWEDAAAYLESLCGGKPDD